MKTERNEEKKKEMNKKESKAKKGKDASKRGKISLCPRYLEVCYCFAGLPVVSKVKRMRIIQFLARSSIHYLRSKALFARRKILFYLTSNGKGLRIYIMRYPMP